MPAGAAELADGVTQVLLQEAQEEHEQPTQKVRHPSRDAGPLCVRGSRGGALAAGPGIYLTGIPATGTCTMPPAAFLEPRFSIQIASRETEKLMAM